MSNNIEQFVRFLIDMGGVYEVDTDGYVVNRVDKDIPVMIKAAGSKSTYKRLMVMKDLITDDEAIVINPFSENSASDSPDAIWLYTQLSVGFTSKIIGIVRAVNMIATSDDSIPYTADAVKYAAKFPKFGEKEIKLFNQLVSKPTEFMNVWYLRKLKESRFRCALYDPDTLAAYPNVSKKVWAAVIALISDLLGIKDIENADAEIKEMYTYQSKLITIPKLESILQIYLRLYQQINPTLMIMHGSDAVDDDAVDITTLSHHLQHLEEYYDKAKWFTTPKKTPIPVTESSVKVSTSMIPSGKPSLSIPDSKPRMSIPNTGQFSNMPRQGGFTQPTQSWFGQNQPLRPSWSIPIR